VIDRIEEILRKLAESDTSAPVRQAASSSIDRLQAKRSVPSSLQALKSGSLADRMRIVHSAEDIGGREGVTLLLAALDDPDAEVRGAAALSLSFSPTVPVLKALAERLHKEQGFVLGNILETLGNSRRKELAPVIGRYLGHQDPFVCSKAVKAYSLLAEKDDWEKVLQLAGSENETIRAAAAEALSEWSAEAPAG
jgi:hypothetical protein